MSATAIQIRAIVFLYVVLCGRYHGAFVLQAQSIKIQYEIKQKSDGAYNSGGKVKLS